MYYWKQSTQIKLRILFKFEENMGGKIGKEIDKIHCSDFSLFSLFFHSSLVKIAINFKIKVIKKNI